MFRTKRRGTISPFFIGFPLVVMICSVILASNSLNSLQGSANNTPVICNANNLANGGSCTQVPGSTTYSCYNANQGALIPCAINGADGKHLPCPANPPPPSYCGPTIPVIQPTAVWFIPNFSTVVIAGNLTVPANSAAGVFFGLGSVGNSGFIAMIGIIIGIVCLAGLTIFGTGTSSESVHILFMGGLLMGIWIFFSGLDGFLSSSPGSIFVQLDSLSAGVGTGFYIILTFMYLFGFMGMVKRGA